MIAEKKCFAVKKCQFVLKEKVHKSDCVRGLHDGEDEIQNSIFNLNKSWGIFSLNVNLFKILNSN